MNKLYCDVIPSFLVSYIKRNYSQSEQVIIWIHIFKFIIQTWLSLEKIEMLRHILLMNFTWWFVYLRFPRLAIWIMFEPKMIHSLPLQDRKNRKIWISLEENLTYKFSRMLTDRVEDASMAMCKFMFGWKGMKDFLILH